MHRALIVTPTRELAEQINDTVRALGKGTEYAQRDDLRRRVDAVPQERALTRRRRDSGGDCPGRLLDHIGAGRCRLDRIEVLVLDEADRMFDMGFLPAGAPHPQPCAGEAPDHAVLGHLPARDRAARRGRRCANPQRIDGGPEPGRATTVAHALYPCRQHLKTGLTLALLKQTDTHSVLIFTRTKHRASTPGAAARASGLSCHHRCTAIAAQNQRQSALDGFRDGTYQIMVATDIAARGIDVESISHVINYDMPDTADAYIHRIGRTGRAEREGDAFTMITPEDDVMVRTIERALGQPIARQTLEGFDYNAPRRRRRPASRSLAEQPRHRSARRAAGPPWHAPAAGRPARRPSPRRDRGSAR